MVSKRPLCLSPPHESGREPSLCHLPVGARGSSGSFWSIFLTGFLKFRIAGLNEALTIGKVVRDFQKALPQARVYVCDNGSTDGSPDIAKQAKAHLFHETLRGKGYAVRRMFQDIDADIYLLLDGDDTYDPALAPTMVLDILEGSFDLVNAIRCPVEGENAYRYGHRFGNRLLTKAVRTIFGDRVKDMLSGYKAMSHRFVKSFPALSEGFEIETEIIVHALELGLSIGHR